MSSPGPVETEIKLAVADTASAGTLLTGHGFVVAKPRVFEANIIFDTNSHDLRSSGSMLRVRSAGTENILTFKGRAERTRHKCREEIEIGISNAAAASSILSRLGYQPAFRYEKYRTEFTRSGEAGVVMLDETPIGCFLELEGEAAWIDRIAIELGFSDSDYNTASYGSLYTQYCAARDVQPTNMVFQDTLLV